MREEKLYRYIGARIEEERDCDGISKSEMAKALDVSRDYINKIEGGRTKITLPVFLQICSYLDVSMDFLLDPPIPEDVFPYNPGPYHKTEKSVSGDNDLLSDHTTNQHLSPAELKLPSERIDMEMGSKSALLELLKKYQAALEESGLTLVQINDLGIQRTIQYLQQDLESDYQREGLSDKEEIEKMARNYRRAGRRKKYSTETEAWVVQLSTDGNSLREISQQTSIPESTIYDILRRNRNT